MRTGRAHYHEVCIGAEDRRAGSSQLRSDWRGSASERLYTFRTYAAILAHRRLDAVAAMKMDIEGFGIRARLPIAAASLVQYCTAALSPAAAVLPVAAQPRGRVGLSLSGPTEPLRLYCACEPAT